MIEIRRLREGSRTLVVATEVRTTISDFFQVMLVLIAILSES